MAILTLIADRIQNPLLPDQVSTMDQTPAILSQTLSNVLTLLLIGAGVAFFFMFVAGGLRWILSAGDKEKVEGAKKQISSAIIGLVLILLVFAVVSLIRTLFGINLVRFNLPRLFSGPSRLVFVTL
ncbi:MAG: pilin [Candidatus Shapirobacteria bacterium]|nr:pilin [Candidatus Shapirobacteria bacterium]